MRDRILAAIALVSVVHPVAGQDGPRPRSVLFYLVDTCRHDRMSFDGYERKTTPFLEWLAERSVVFEACYGQAAWTKPSMASMLSSQYPSTTGVYRMEHRLPDPIVTWPEVLKANGMHTAGFSTNIVMGNVLSNFAQGFDHFVESTLINQGDPIRFASGSARKLNEHAFAWLDRTDHWPMLLYLHSVDPHEEYEPEPEYLEQFADPERHERFREEWKKLLQSRPPIPGLYVTQDNFDRTGVDAASFLDHASKLYDADILANDDQMQELWDKLQEDGWGEDFIFVFTSDHGEEFFDHGGTSHGYSLYEEMVRVPLLIHAPGLLPEGKRIATPVRSLDIYPTLCDLLGFEAPGDLEGESLVPLIQGPGPGDSGDDRPIFSEHREDPLTRRMGQGSGTLVSLRSGSWKFILNQTSSQLIDRPRVELYDLETDPGEQNNVADLHPEEVQRFEQAAATFIERQWAPSSEVASSTMDPEVLEQLRALGYVGMEDDAPDLWQAMGTGDLEEVQATLGAGADPDQLDDVLGVRPLSMAALAGNVELARVLLDGGATVDARNRDGSTPLSGAAFLGRVEMLELLLDEGADPAIRSVTGDTALSATRAPWDVTEYIAGLLQIPLARAEVEAGRKRCAELLREEAHAPGQVAVTYLANEGFLLEAQESGILIDAFVTKPHLEYAALPPAVFRRMLQEEAPFQRVELALVSHAHADHFQAAAAAEFLRHNELATVASSPEVVDTLREEFPEGEAPLDQMQSFLPEPGGTEELAGDGWQVEFLLLPHGSDRSLPTNLGHLITWNGLRILHVGDADMEEKNFAPYRLAERDLDVALIPYWFFLDEVGQSIIERHLRARQRIAMHVPPGELAATTQWLAEHEPGVLVFQEPLASRVFPAADR